MLRNYIHVFLCSSLFPTGIGASSIEAYNFNGDLMGYIYVAGPARNVLAEPVSYLVSMHMHRPLQSSTIDRQPQTITSCKEARAVLNSPRTSLCC